MHNVRLTPDRTLWSLLLMHNVRLTGQRTITDLKAVKALLSENRIYKLI